MDKFRFKRKGPESGPTGDAFTTVSPPPPTSPGVKKSTTSRWKKTKKPTEQKPELNIASALPSTDHFRTSLLMPNLSARFSMLREQDDPNSLLGKASDDSVLQPRRRSRMTDFGFSSPALNDIAEVQSIRSSTRPLFTEGRGDSYGSQDGDGSEDDPNGSMMSRARRGEGNTMFGGRQKVFKIPTTGANPDKPLGKAVYEDDIGMSAFQKFKQRERDEAQARGSEDSQGFDFGLDHNYDGIYHRAHDATPNDSAKDLSQSPSPSTYDKKRLTASSTGHSEARSSTAATSIASQPVTSAPTQQFGTTQQPPPVAMSALKRNDTKTRRLYEQGLDQHMHDQQTSALTRLKSIQRQRPLNGPKQSPPYLHGARSATNLNGRLPQPVFALSAQSPPHVRRAPAPLTTFESMRNPNSNSGSPLQSGPQSPTSPTAFEFGETTALTEALEPADRGKATAMGAFNKPAQTFDEDQYLERQRQLQRSQSHVGLKKEPAASSALQQRLGRLQQLDRKRSDSDVSTRSRSTSASKTHDPSKAYNVFQQAARQIQAQAGAQQLDKPSLPDTHRTFFGNISASDSEEEEDEEARDHFQTQPDYSYDNHRGWHPTPLPPVSEHPAFREQVSHASLTEAPDYVEPKSLIPTPSGQVLRTDAIKAEKDRIEEVEEPTLGPRNTEQLSSMVYHLRQKSTGSSIYPGDDPAPMEDVPEVPEMTWNAKTSGKPRSTPRSESRAESRAESSHTNSNPWDLDDVSSNFNHSRGGADHHSVSPLEDGRHDTPEGSRAPSRANAPYDRQSEVSQDSEGASGAPWQQELRKQHTRDVSGATQKERDAFASELASRRNAIQENMKSMAQRERGVSPAPSASGTRKAFGMLRSMSSRESVEISKRELVAPPKAMKTLGLGAHASNATLSSQYERSGQSFDVGRPRDNSVGSRVPPVSSSQLRGSQPSDWEPRRVRGDSEISRSEFQPPIRSSPAASEAGGVRSRSNSQAAGGRSRSRTGPYRDDLEKAMVEGTGSSAAGHPELSPMVPRELTPRPSPEVVQSQFDHQDRARSNSRTGMNNYFDAKNLQPIQTAQNGRFVPNGTPLSGLSPNVYSPTGIPARSPLSSSPYAQSSTPPPPYAQNFTPPLSGPNTPQTAGFPPPHMPITQPRQTTLRKKTVAKSDISEPTLVSSTSNVETIDLPEGASLKNGMDMAPPVPPINPKRRGGRRVFGLGRAEQSEDAHNYTSSNFGRSNTPDPWMMSRAPEPDFPFERAARPARPHVDGHLNSVPKRPGFDNHSSPALQQYGLATMATSPDRVKRPPILPTAVRMEGGMF